MDIHYSKEKKYNKYILLFLFTFSLFSGAIRKWIIDESVINLGITVLQVVCPFSLLLIRKEKGSLFKENLQKLLGVFLFYLCLTAVNPIIPSFYHGAIGIVIHLSFWIAIFIYISNRSVVETASLQKIILLLIIFEAVLAIVQYQLPYDSFLNRYAGGEASEDYFIAQVGDAVRVTGTFSYLSGFTGFILFFQLFVFATFIKNNNTVQFNILSIIGIILAVISGSRASVFVYLILFLSFLSFQLKKKQIKKIILPLILIPVCFFLLSFIMDTPIYIKDFIDNAFSNFNSRIEDSAEESQVRIMTPFLSIINFDLPNIIWGNGLGITYPAANGLFGVAQVVNRYGGQDDEVTRTIIEGGYLLLLLKLILIHSAITNISLDRKFALITFIVIFLYVPLSTNVYNSVFFFLGIVFLDNAIMKQNQRATRDDS